MTTPQFRARTKDVTRRLGWWKLKAGDTLLAVEKSRGLKRGEKVVPLGAIRIASVCQERLDRMELDLEYGEKEVIREGFPGLLPHQFVKMFSEANKCHSHATITRIEFVYL